MKFDMEVAKELRKNGKTFREISVELGVNHSYVRQKLRGLPREVENIRNEIPERLKSIVRELSDIVESLSKDN